MLQQSGQTICILIIQRALGSHAVNRDAKTHLGEVKKVTSNSEPRLSLTDGDWRTEFAGRSGVGLSQHSSCSSSAGMQSKLERSTRWECFKKGLAMFLQLLSAAQDPRQGQVSSGSFFL